MNKIAQAAKEVKGRWHKGDASDRQGNFCGLGHLWIVHGFNPESEKMPPYEVSEQMTIMGQVAYEMFPDRFGWSSWFASMPGKPAFAEFNDNPDTTEDEVIAVMEKAAVRWDERV